MPLTAVQMRRGGARAGTVALEAAPTLGGRAVVQAVRAFATGQNNFAAAQGRTGQTLGLAVTVANGTAAAIVVQARASLYSTGGSAALGTVDAGGSVYPVAAAMTVAGQAVGIASIPAGGTQTFRFAVPLAAVAYPMGVYVSVSVADEAGRTLPDSPLVAWTNAFLTVGTGATSSAIDLGTPASTALAAGGNLSMQGASVIVSGSPWWTLTVQAVDGAGRTLGQAQVLGQGSASGQSYTLGPLNEAGAQVSLRGSLQFYADGARTQAIGGPVTASTGVVASTAAAVTVGQVTGLAAAASGADAFTLTWVPAGSYTEVQFTDATGTQPLGTLIGSPYIGQGGGIEGNGTTTFDRPATLVAAYSGLFTPDSTARVTLPPGTTAYVRARASSGIGSSGNFGPWTGPVELQTAPGAPDLHIVNLSVTPAEVPVRTSTDPYAQAQAIPDAFTVSFAVQNRGTAVGYIGGAACAAVMGDEAFGYGNAGGYYALQPGQTSPQFGLQMMMGWVQSDGVWQVAPSGLYTVYADWKDVQGNSSLDWAGPGATAGSPGRAVSVQVQFPGGSASGSFSVRARPALRLVKR